MKIYLLSGEKSLSAEMEIVFTELLISGRSEKREEIPRSSDSLFEKKKERFLSCNFSPQTP